MTNWPAIIADLHSLGWRYLDIAVEIDMEEYWVSRVARGFTRKVDYDVALRLLDLHRRELGCSVVSRDTVAKLQVAD